MHTTKRERARLSLNTHARVCLCGHERMRACMSASPDSEKACDFYAAFAVQHKSKRRLWRLIHHNSWWLSVPAGVVVPSVHQPLSLSHTHAHSHTLTHSFALWPCAGVRVGWA
eukprot:2065947-Pleurochrysis_carterae.AAC.1